MFINWYHKYSPILFGAATVAALVQSQPVLALNASQVSELAKSITVRIDGQFTGSGFLVGQENNIYTLVTNRHVVKEKGSYIITTSDSCQYTVNDEQIQRFNDVDLAIIHFNSAAKYTVAQLGESEKVQEGETIYLAGYPNPGSVDKGRSYRFLTVRITGRLDTPSEEGYGLVYDGLAIEGMSGGPVLDGDGKVIGIHGQAEIHPVAGAVSNYGIPIKTFLARKGSLSLPQMPINKPGDSRFQELLSLGNKQKDRGDYHAAIKTYGEALKLNSQSAVVYYNRGWTYNQLENFQLAREDLTQAIRLNPNYTDAYVSRSHSRFKLGDSRGTIEDCDQALRLNPKYVIAYDNRGVARGNLGDLKGAIEDHTEAIRLDPNFANAYYSRGWAWGELGEYSKAVNDYTQAIAINPKYADAYHNRGWNFTKLGEYQKAISDFTQTIQLDPNYANAYYNRGNAYGNLNQKQKAIADFEKAAQLYQQQNNPTWYQNSQERARELREK